MNEIDFLTKENKKIKENCEEIKEIRKKSTDDLFFLEVKARKIIKLQVS